MAEVAVVTGPITGRIPIKHAKHPEGFVDVTPYVVYTDDLDHAHAIADAIEVEHHVRGTHPLQTECAYLDDVTQHPNGLDPERIKAHRAAHKALNKKVGA